MIATVTPIRLRRWAPPRIYTHFERVSDGKVFQCRMVWHKDQQVRLESADGERAFPFANQLREDWRVMV